MRVVRFADVDSDRLNELLGQIDEKGGPPPGVPAKGLQILADEAQGTAVVLQVFETADDMRDAEQAFDQMDPAETPGRRVSVDRCEVKLEIGAPSTAGR